MTEFLPQVDSFKCIGCELCVRECPNHALAWMDNTVIVINPTACDYSGVCQEICPTEAISLIYELIFAVDFSDEGSGPMFMKQDQQQNPSLSQD